MIDVDAEGEVHSSLVTRFHVPARFQLSRMLKRLHQSAADGEDANRTLSQASSRNISFARRVPALEEIRRLHDAAPT